MLDRHGTSKGRQHTLSRCVMPLQKQEENTERQAQTRTHTHRQTYLSRNEQFCFKYPVTSNGKVIEMSLNIQTQLLTEIKQKTVLKSSQSDGISISF